MLSGNNNQIPLNFNQDLSSGVNFGLLTPSNQIDPIQSASPQAQPVSLPASSSQATPSPNTTSNLISSLGTAGEALSRLLQGNDPTAITQRLGQDSRSSIFNNLQTSQQRADLGPLLSQNTMLGRVSQAAQQQFPGNLTLQQLAIAQATQESGLLGGKPSQLASKYNNIFGMKGEGANLPTNEYVNGKKETLYQNFQAYNSIDESMAAYKKLLNNPRYAGVLKAKTFEEAARAIQSAGYATDPHYAKSLMQVNQQLSSIKTVSDAHNQPTPNIKDGYPIPPEMEKTPAFHQAITAYAQARQQGTTKSPYVVSIDFSQPATAKRLSVINAETGKVVLQSEVAQGKGGFSNEPGSNASSLGTFQTTQTYDGKHGQSLRIKGLNKGLNDNVEERDVVVHGANYIGHGKTGHSFGCFAVPEDVAPKLINLIKDGVIIQASAGTPGL